MSTIAIAGINGFAGHHVANAAVNSGHNVIGISREQDISPMLRDIVMSYVSCDLADASAVGSLNILGYDSIINLAGFAKVGVSENERADYLRVNAAVHTNLANVLVFNGHNTRMISVSSGAVYSPAQAMPLTEQSKIVAPNAAGVYAASKLHMEEELQNYIIKGANIIIARPFNHSGPGQQPGFLIPDLALRIQSAQPESEILCGNLTTKRDYTHVDDVARAYVLLATAAKLSSRLYNICSGTSTKGTRVFELLTHNLNKSGVLCRVDPDLQRLNDPSELYGSFELLHDDKGWKPSKKIDQIIRDYATWLKDSAL